MEALAWWFGEANGKLRFGDNRKVEENKVLSHVDELIICRRGLHACRNILDAGTYTGLLKLKSPILWRVRVEDFIEQSDKLCSRFRTHLWKVDAKNAFEAFSRFVALSVLDKWPYTEEVEVFLKSGIGDKKLIRDVASYNGTIANSAISIAASMAALYSAYGDQFSAAKCVLNFARMAGTKINSMYLENMIEEAKNGRTEWTFDKI